MKSEEELARALRTIGERAEVLDLLPRVAERRRRRRARRARAALAAVCAVVLGWSVVALWPARQAPVIGTPEPVTAVERMWPRAVFTMPGRYRPLAAIDATRVLVTAEPGTIEVYDSATGRSRTVVTLPDLRHRVAASGAWVVWMDDEEVGFAPTDGTGEAGRQRLPDGDDVDRMEIAGDEVVWSAPLDGVWRMSLPGGTIERVPGSDGLQLAAWPWATDEPLDIRTNPTRLVNLETGETVRIRPARGVEGLRCGPTWCLGVRDGDAVVQRIDGSQARVQPELGGQVGSYPYADRFFDGSAVYDAAAGVLVPIESDEWSSGPGVVAWEARGGGVRVLNLAAIPPAR
ncbi:hypothetical protein GCM10009850_041530 [Nonomuraea monospora]|uniref:Uncharacterized protein n=1 Tax=Nonomuraea monospora TaxID=568818 RepID=A0ABP5PA96_9ACTN